MYSANEPPTGHRHPLARGASPEAIAAALLPEDRTEFLTKYAAALTTARDSLDLTSPFQMLEPGVGSRRCKPTRRCSAASPDVPRSY